VELRGRGKDVKVKGRLLKDMEEDKEINEGNRVTMFKVWYMDV
jgi:hypothetical protein